MGSKLVKAYNATKEAREQFKQWLDDENSYKTNLRKDTYKKPTYGQYIADNTLALLDEDSRLIPLENGKFGFNDLPNVELSLEDSALLDVLYKRYLNDYSTSFNKYSLPQFYNVLPIDFSKPETSLYEKLYSLATDKNPTTDLKKELVAFLNQNHNLEEANNQANKFANFFRQNAPSYEEYESEIKSARNAFNKERAAHNAPELKRVNTTKNYIIDNLLTPKKTSMFGKKVTGYGAMIIDAVNQLAKNRKLMGELEGKSGKITLDNGSVESIFKPAPEQYASPDKIEEFILNRPKDFPYITRINNIYKDLHNRESIITDTSRFGGYEPKLLTDIAKEAERNNIINHNISGNQLNFTSPEEARLLNEYPNSPVRRFIGGNGNGMLYGVNSIGNGILQNISDETWKKLEEYAAFIGNNYEIFTDPMLKALPLSFLTAMVQTANRLKGTSKKKAFIKYLLANELVGGATGVAVKGINRASTDDKDTTEKPIEMSENW